MTALAIFLVNIVILAIRHSEFSSIVLDPEVLKQVTSLQRRSVYMGAVSSFGLFGVALFNVSFSIQVHLLWAFLAFFTGVAYIITQTMIDRKIQSCDPKIFRVRQMLCIVSIFGLLGMFISINFSLAVSSFFELLMVASLLVYFSTWRGKFKSRMYLTVELMREKEGDAESTQTIL